MAGTVDINSVPIEGVVILPAGVNIASVNCHPIAIQDEKTPIRRIGQFNILDGDILAVHEPDHLRGTRGNQRFFRVPLSFRVQQECIRIAVNLSRAADRHMLHINAKQEMAAGNIIPMTDFRYVLRAAVGIAVIGDIGAAFDDSTGFKMQLNVAPKPEGTAKIGPGGDVHDASRSGRTLNRRLNSLRIKRHAIPYGAKIPHGDILRKGSCRKQQGEKKQ